MGARPARRWPRSPRTAILTSISRGTLQCRPACVRALYAACDRVPHRRDNMGGKGVRSEVPDWSYRTLLRPALFTLSPEQARDLTLGAMATLAALPGGGLLIEAFGDLAPPPALSTVLAGVPVRSPIGI